ncbi:endoglin [Silurus meridionalis]|uniref:endoglin n=1 Tax=Silurus meridionalis TaxID=175797 RepID=UPI001EEBC8C4|nr:endoglin [Silurus meridionalis]
MLLYASKNIMLIQQQSSMAPDAQGSELVSWATAQFGGVSSFTTINNPSNISFIETKETPSVSICELKPESAKTMKSLRFISENKGVKSCRFEESEDEVHIIHIPGHLGSRNVFVDVDPAFVKLILRGPNGTVWTINSNNVSFKSNNVISLNGMTVTRLSDLSDDDDELRNQALHYFRSKSIKSYTKIYLKGPIIQVKILKKKTSEVTERSKPTEAPTSPTWMKLFTSPDYSVQLDSSTKVPTNKRLYAQVWSLLHGNVDLNIKVTSCYVHSKGLQPLERSVSLKQEPCLACYNNTRFSFLLDTLQDLPTNNWELRCNVTHCMKSTAVVSCAQPELVTENVQVVPSLVPSTPNQCVDFSLQSVLGIAFGGFLIGVLLIGALWFIKIRTGYPGSLGFGLSETFFSGCPCGLTKHHAVPTNPSPSENSSANGSMSSTQSTPSSSMA